MSPTNPHPSLSMPVTAEQRERAEAWLQEAYADGRIAEDEFDRRIGEVLSSTTRQDLNQAFYGLVQLPAVSPAWEPGGAYRYYPERRDLPTGRAAASLAHFLALIFWLLGPGLIYAVSRPGSYARREAARAFNFTLVSWGALLGVSIIGNITNSGVLDIVGGLIFVAWVVLTIVGGAKAAQGEDWKNPLGRMVKPKILSEK